MNKKILRKVLKKLLKIVLTSVSKKTSSQFSKLNKNLIEWLLILMTVYCMLDYVMFDISIVTCMDSWIEIEITSLVILKNFFTAILMYITVVLLWDVYQNHCFHYFM